MAGVAWPAAAATKTVPAAAGPSVRSGIVVVTAVGNAGTTATGVTDPAANPFVLAVGATDLHGTVSIGDDTVASFSSLGSASRHADVLAPGAGVVSPRVPGGQLDLAYPAARTAWTGSAWTDAVWG